MSLFDPQEIAKVQVFEGVDPVLLAPVLEQHAREVTLAPGELLLSPEKENRHLYLVLSGQLEVRVKHIRGPLLRRVQAGESVGEMSVIEHARPSAWVLAGNKPTRLIAVEDEAFWRLVERAGVVGRNLMRIVVRWLRNNTENLVAQWERIDVLEAQSYRDALTGCYNRRWFDEALALGVQEAVEAGGEPLSLALIDVDKFKTYNDSYGHQAGDQALKALGQCLREMARSHDRAVRYGGEEFAVLMPQTTLEQAHEAGERIRRAVERLAIFDHAGVPLPHITLSMGLAQSDNESTPQSMIDHADQYLYEAKQAGRNRVCG
ncbi:GGDEF domain-containing protein [Magnetofaba australis]|uniref:diguanylate cyclase n=1 Tax=Magnetofaba australis IT-1 TaxID=1434232 RepID=A0A1Y2K1H3_9PROT|nr:GGDEF domain-containing protein [Magnetofaba australis]OSM01880.1 putative cyclic nucleotide-binding protein [Magnetofaba australis IT-1]